MPRIFPAAFDCCSRSVERFPSRAFDGLVHVAFELADIVEPVRLGAVGKLLRTDEIAAADFLRRQAEVARAGIDQLFEQECRLGPAGAAISIDRAGIRVDARDRHIERLDVIDAGRHGGPDVRNEGAVLRNISAEVGDQLDAQAEEAAIGIHRHLGGHDVVAALRVGEEMLGAVARPFDRLAEPLRGFQHQRMLAIDETFGAEPAADVGRDHAKLLRLDAEHAGKDGLHRMHALRAGGQHETIFVGVPFADGGARSM